MRFWILTTIYEDIQFKNFHSNFKKFVCLQPESYEKVGSSDMLKELIELYKDDIDSSDDVLQEYNLLCNTQNLPRTTGKVLKYLNDKNLVHVFPNIVTLIRIYLTIPASSASAERSFSRLKLIQSYLRSSMATERLQGLALLSIERKNSANLIDFDSVLDTFAKMKKRKIILH